MEAPLEDQRCDIHASDKQFVDFFPCARSFKYVPFDSLFMFCVNTNQSERICIAALIVPLQSRQNPGAIGYSTGLGRSSTYILPAEPTTYDQ